MAFELDHFMRFVPGPQAAQPLVEAGWVVGHEGLQPGTGAGHTVFFFDNAYVELVWPEPGRVPFADTPAMRIADRCAQRLCPFGVSLRPTKRGRTVDIPLQTWPHAASFLPEGAIPIPVGANSELDEPLVVVSLVSGRPDSRRERPPLQVIAREITAATVVLPGSGCSPEMTAVAEVCPVRIESGRRAALVLQLDGERERPFRRGWWVAK